MGDPTIDSKIAAAVQSLNTFESQENLPSSVNVTASVTEGGNGSITVTEYVQDSDITRTLKFKIRSDTNDGYQILTDTLSSSLKVGDSTLAPYASLITRSLNSPSQITWLKEAILKKAYTANADLSDERTNTAALKPNSGFSANEQIAVLQDCLQGVIEGEPFSIEDQLTIAGFLANPPEGFFDVIPGTLYSTGIPWAELYFTKFLLVKAMAMPAAQDPYLSQMYELSLTSLNSAIKSRQYEEFCVSRGVVGDYLSSGIAQSTADEEQCDIYDAEIELTDPSYYPNSDLLMPPPFKAGSPTTLSAVMAQPITQTVIETAIQQTPDILDRNRVDVIRTAVVALDIANTLMTDPAFIAALDTLTTTLTASDGNPDTKQVSDIFNGLIIQSLTKGLGMSSDFVSANNGQIQQLSTTFSELLLRAARDPSLKREIKGLSLDYLQLAVQVLQDPRAKESIKQIALTSMSLTADIMADPEFAKQMDALTTTSLALATTLMTNHQTELTAILDFGTRLGIRGAAAALSSTDPTDVAAREALVTSIVAMISLGQQQMTSILMADPNLKPYIEQMDQLMGLMQAYLEKKTRSGRVAPLPPQGSFHHQQEALLASMDHWEEMKKLTIRGYAVEAQQLDKANGANLKEGHLRGEMPIPEGLSAQDVIKSMTAQSRHANTITTDLKANTLLAQDGTELNLETAPKDQFGNPCSYKDAQGNSHYIVFQYLTVDPLKLAYVIDLVLVETADAYILSWNRATDQYKSYVDAQAAHGMKGSESSTNFGNWYVKKDGSAMGYSICASGIGILISAAPSRLAANVVDMAEFAKRQKTGE